MTLLLQQWSDNMAQLRGDAVALVTRDEVLNYNELFVLSNRIAHALIDSGCQQGDRVCLLMPKSAIAIAAILGIYKADCIYVPLDTSNPVTRLGKIVQSCDCRCILAVAEVADKLDTLLDQQGLRGKTVIGWLDADHTPQSSSPQDFCLREVHACSAAVRTYHNTASSTAHILFTSGSTGEPKGVMLSHANVIAFVRWAVKYFGIDASDRLSGHSPLHFDLSIFDIFGAQAAGAQLHLVGNDLSLLPHKLARWIRDSQLTQWFSVPSLLNYLCKFDAVTFNDFPALKRLLWCGEVLPTPTLQYWMRRLPHVRFTNLYGPTETTIASSYYTVPRCPVDEREPIPIGHACAGEELLVLDDRWQSLPAGVEGDLYIRGVGLAQGYWRDEKKTREVFLSGHSIHGDDSLIYKTGDRAKQDSNGLYYYLGRNDMQIKSRGYRIDLGEIEAALATLGYLRESAVVAINDESFSNFTICCAYVEGNSEQMPTLVKMRSDLANLVPPYMIPSRWQLLGNLPRNANGKIDRPKLREQFAADAILARRQA